MTSHHPAHQLTLSPKAARGVTVGMGQSSQSDSGVKCHAVASAINRLSHNKADTPTTRLTDVALHYITVDASALTGQKKYRTGFYARGFSKALNEELHVLHNTIYVI